MSTGKTGKDKRRIIMTELKLLALKLKNFKGIKNFELEPDGNDLRIYGENGTGKTTLYDSFYWLLFDKDSKGNSQFDIKTLDQNNEVIHNLEHQVSAEIEINDKKMELRKVYYEKWTKKRGSATETFTGHTTDYYINDVPIKKSEYDAKINELIDEEMFKLLTNSAYFNEQLHWEDRKDILFEAFGDVSDEEVIESDERLKKLSEALEDRSMKEHRKMIKSKMKKINKDLEKIPVRIDEVNNNIPEPPEDNKKFIKENIQQHKNVKKKLEKKLSGIENGGEIAEKRKKLAEMDTELQQIKHDHTEKYDEKIKETKQDIEEVKDQLSDLDRKITNKKLKLADKKERIETIKGEMNELRKSWNKVNSEEVRVEGGCTCPNCGEEFLPEHLEKSLKKSKLDKSHRLENINQNGIQKKQKVEKLKEETADLGEEIQSLEEQLPGLKKVKDDLFDELSELKEKAEAYQDSFQYKKKLKERENVEEAIKELQENKEDSKAEIKENIKNVESEINDLQAELNKFEQKKKAEERIEELSAQEKELAQKYEEFEHQLYLMEEFDRAKVDLVESKINDHFELANFKLFEEQVNGGLKDTCETLYKGVPYSSGLNNGAQINVGLDNINTLSKHYGFKAPVFVDNAESVTELLDIDSQMIKLIVSPGDDELRVEEETKKIKEAS
jgi:DNA repair exonuclease SbcCD ATPase subunit